MHAQHKEMHMITRFPGVHMWVYVNTHVNKSIVPKTVGVYDHQVPWCSYVGLHKYACQHNTEKFVHKMQVTSRKQTNIACYWVSTPCSVKCTCKNVLLTECSVKFVICAFNPSTNASIHVNRQHNALSTITCVHTCQHRLQPKSSSCTSTTTCMSMHIYNKRLCFACMSTIA